METERIKKLKNFMHQQIFEYFYLKNSFLLMREKFQSPRKRFRKKKKLKIKILKKKFK